MDSLDHRLDMSALADALERDSAGVKCACGRAVHWPVSGACIVCAKEADIQLIDVRQEGDEGHCVVYAMVAGEEQKARVLWQPDVGDLDVISADSAAMERFVCSDSEAQDLVEARHSEFIAAGAYWTFEPVEA